MTSSSTASSAQAEVASTATGGIIIINQEPIDGLVGHWTLLKPYHLNESSRVEEKRIAGWAGTYTLIIEPPESAVARLRILRGNETILSVDRPQATFTLNAGEELHISVHYSFFKTGDIAISSDPPGLAYKLTGPNNVKLEGTTPGSYETMPLGQYAVSYVQPEGCPAIPVKSDQLQEMKRISFHVKLECAAAAAMRAEAQEQKDTYVTVLVDGADLALTDVPQSAWFATYVFDAAKGGMLSGYKDDEGEYTGLFGPENPVTVAELAKMAHRIGGVQESEITESSTNRDVTSNAWFAQYMASAEHRGWTIYADATIDPLRPATRAEVIVTLLQALDIPVSWPTNDIFTDVSWKTTPFAGAIETAAADGVVAGRTDEAGAPTGLFSPDDPVIRAEMAAILVRARDAYRME